MAYKACQVWWNNKEVSNVFQHKDRQAGEVKRPSNLPHVVGADKVQCVVAMGGS